MKRSAGVGSGVAAILDKIPRKDPMERLRRTINAVLSLGLVGGGATLVALINSKPAPPAVPNFTHTPSVSVVEVRGRAVGTPVVGYGTIRPKSQVNIVPQVSGKLIFAHEALAEGNVIPKGELLYEIDSADYVARVHQVEAEIRGLEAMLKRQDQEIANLDTRIENLERMLVIDENDYLTSKNLYEIETVGTQRDVDLVFKKFLHQKGLVVDLKNQRALAPHMRRETQARLEGARAELKLAKHDLAATKILSPFEARVESVRAQRSQFVTASFAIATLTDMSAFEFSVGIDPRDLRWLDEAVRPQVLSNEETLYGPAVTVSWSLFGQEFTWRGHVTRFERFDEATRTGRLVVEVRGRDMVAALEKGSGEFRPTLSIGMHCRADLPAELLDDALLVPRHAVYEHRWVYVFEPDPESPDGLTGTLGRREVPLLRNLGEHVLVDYAGRTGSDSCELQDGEFVITSPLTRTVVGMKLTRRDEAFAIEPTLPAANPPAWDRKTPKREGALALSVH
ncbi:MAG: hypothetical protein IIB57_09760 [Planctomycetes bacterium]|nr:hypothetical protein [Planctomycetota bacterium]